MILITEGKHAGKVVRFIHKTTYRLDRKTGLRYGRYTAAYFVDREKNRVFYAYTRMNPADHQYVKELGRKAALAKLEQEAFEMTPSDFICEDHWAVSQAPFTRSLMENMAARVDNLRHHYISQMISEKVYMKEDCIDFLSY